MVVMINPAPSSRTRPFALYTSLAEVAFVDKFPTYEQRLQVRYLRFGLRDREPERLTGSHHHRHHPLQHAFVVIAKKCLHCQHTVFSTAYELLATPRRR